MKAFIFYFILALLTLLAIGVVTSKLHPAFGQKAKGAELEQLEKSKNYQDGRFRNAEKIQMSTTENRLPGAMFYDYLFKSRGVRRPQSPLKTVKIDQEAYKEVQSNVALISWLGHSTILMKLEDTTIITDPILSNRASPFKHIGPKKFDYENEINVEDLPKIDAVVISHDHYDHLDYQTIQKLAKRVEMFFVPLGVKAHLVKWGVSEEKIKSMDWEEEVQFKDLKLTALPARHFSGRSFDDGGKSLWASWAIRSESISTYFSGDTGYFEGFKDIGQNHGPFDIAFMECGAYSEHWAQVHMHPIQTAQATKDLKADTLLPIHNSKFNLALHAWDEPLNLIKEIAEKEGIKMISPPIGSSTTISK